MNRRMMLLTAAMCFVAVAAAVASDPNMGTWNLNEAQSKFSPGAPMNRTVAYELAGDSVKVVVDGVDGKGQAIHNEWTGKYDGKDYPVTGDQSADARAYTKVNDRTLTFTQKKSGKVTTDGRIVVSEDGKTRTVTTTGTDSQGQKVTATALYEKK
jgi:hypothetical protein